MSASGFGEHFRITTFGESHGPLIGVVIEGVPPGFEIDEAYIWSELKRRAPGQSAVTTQRVESDRPRIVSGVFEGKATGAPVCILIDNEDTRSRDYDAHLMRPGHADITYQAKYGVRDYRGGGRSSGRETAARVAAGAIAKKILASRGTIVTGHTIQIAGIRAATFDRAVIETNPVRCADPAAARLMEAAISDAAAAKDSVGGIVEVIVEGAPAGLGDPTFAKLDALIAMALMSIPAVKGVEIGAGFRAATMRGSEHNDPITPSGFLSNNAGGVLGGISTGQPIVARIAVKPTSSIALAQQTVDIDRAPATIQMRGRHDPCICPRIVPVAESMMAIVLVDRLIAQESLRAIR